MNNKYLFSILLTFIFNGEILASETENENKNTENTEITAKEYSDLLKMKYDDFQNLLVAAEVDISDPDVIFTKENHEINIYNQNYGMFGWGWGPNALGWNRTNVYNSTNGMLFIDFIDANKKELIWQGIGEGYLTNRIDRKENRIKKFVTSILSNYPPEVE